jgi:hypothetical protein
MARSLWPLLAALAAASCTVEEVDFSSKTCPCDQGWTCDTVRNRCVLGNIPDAGLDSGGASGSSGAAGSSGMDGGGGSGNCASTQKLCNGLCVSNSDPGYGCTTTFCDPCPKPTNGSPACSQGSCTLGDCDPGWDDCDGNPLTGCEFAVNDDLNCGACNRTCALDNALSSSCQNAECQPECDTGFLDCVTPPRSSADDGCETSSQSDDRHCGACGNDCSKQGASGGFTCSGGVCGCTASAQCQLTGGLVASCNTTSRVCVCGGTSCAPGEACDKVQGNSRCRCNGSTNCPSGQSCCPSGGCANLSSDASNCGACGNKCGSEQSCVGGVCA